MTSRSRLSLRLVSALVLAGLAATSVAMSLVVRSVINDQQSRLLRERSNDAAALVSSLFATVPTTLPILAEATRPQVGSTAAFTDVASRFVGGPSNTLGALRIADGVVTVVAGVGASAPMGSTVTGASASLAERAESAKGVVTAVIKTAVGPRLYFDLALGDTVVYAAADIGPLRSYQPGPNDPFSELAAAVYASARPSPATLVLATTRHLPLTGAVDRVPVTVGAQKWLLVTRSEQPLVGAFAAAATWWILAAGLIASILASILVETLARRRTYALNLVEERTLALNQATQTAQAANLAKSEFLSRMSHELRTPLNAVLGFAQLLELDELTEAQQESTSQIIKGGRHLLNLINEVLDISRIDSGTLALSLEPVLVSELIDDTLVLMRPLAVHRHIDITVDEGPSPNAYVAADRQRLKQVLLNLVANAIKYNHDGGAVTVSCRPHGGERLRMTVADTGPGIQAEHLDRLFVPFERLGADRTDIEGTGVGLALSRRLAEAMGGAIGVESSYGHGSSFWVELPVAQDPLEGHDDPDERIGDAGRDEPPGAPRRHKVLYIEDNPSNVRLVERLLDRRDDVELISTMQGRMGLSLAHEHHPAVILLDLHLPDVDGDQLLRELRDAPATASIPVIVVSADATDRQIQRLLAQGADSYLTKPLELQSLLAALDNALERATTTVT